MNAYSGGLPRTITMSFFVQNWKCWGIFFPPIMEAGNAKPIYDVFK